MIKNMATPKKGLGRGLSALFSSSIDNIDNNNIIEDINDIIGHNNLDNKIKILKTSDVTPNPNQPRKEFDEKLIENLVISIKDHGVLQPILVRPIKTGGYQIIAGERRWRACKKAGLETIPAIIKDLKDLETLEIALIENLQRSDLNPIEEAMSYKFLIDKYNMSQDSIATKVGKSRPVVANMIRLLNLPEAVIELVRTDKISVGHARALLALEDSEKIKEISQEIISQGLSVRDVERLVKSKKDSTNFKKNRKIIDTSFYKKIEKDISKDLKRNIKINNNKLEIEFFSKEDLDNIINNIKSALK
ncbi:MAG: ParB/RepB/Spo0J family partition protein [Oscillospiraceae bacterium]|nr:ParB/RepB/Spo0J family partition protein [Oscillospiraceae bacterium]